MPDNFPDQPQRLTPGGTAPNPIDVHVWERVPHVQSVPFQPVYPANLDALHDRLAALEAHLLQQAAPPLHPSPESLLARIKALEDRQQADDRDWQELSARVTALEGETTDYTDSTDGKTEIPLSPAFIREIRGEFCSHDWQPSGMFLVNAHGLVRGRQVVGGIVVGGPDNHQTPELEMCRRCGLLRVPGAKDGAAT